MLKMRFFPNGQRMNEVETTKYVDALIKESYDNWRTKTYDRF